jgi:hypothetical protein
LTSPQAKKAFLVSRDLFAEPGVAERCDELVFEACRISGKSMLMVEALRFLAERGNAEATGLLAALDYPYAKPLARKRGAPGA